MHVQTVVYKKIFKRTKLIYLNFLTRTWPCIYSYEDVTEFKELYEEIKAKNIIILHILLHVNFQPSTAENG